MKKSVNSASEKKLTKSKLATTVTAVAIVGSVAGCASSGSVPEQGQAAEILAQMTLEEKIQMLHGAENSEAGAGAIEGIKRLNIPDILLTDGPAGARNPIYQATAMPAPVSLASSFNPQLAYQVGQVIGKEARAHGQDVLLSPMVNIVRTPMAGRNFETLGEDPLLAGDMVTEQIKGVQDAGLMATVKHFAVNNQETDRMTINTVVDERTLREIYLPAFEKAVREAKVASIMGAYNKVAIDGENSNYAVANKELLTDILRNEWGFDGFVMSDWFAGIPGVFTPDMDPTPTHITAGLDLEMPAQFMFGDLLLEAVKKGDIDESYVDRSVSRILTQLERFGLLDDTAPEREKIEALSKAHAKVAKLAALQGAVLLKNDKQALPLDPDALESVLIVGQTGSVLNYGGGGSSRVKPLVDLKGPLESLQELSGSDIRYSFLPGIDPDGAVIPASALKNLTITNRGQEPQPATNISFTGEHSLPAGSEIEWLGELVAPESGDYEINLQAKNGVVKLSLDGGESFLLDSDAMFNPFNTVLATREGLENSSTVISMQAGEVKKFKLVAKAGRGGMFSKFVNDEAAPMEVRLAWTTPSQKKANFTKAVEAAANADTVIVFGHNEGTEGVDRQNLALPHNQDALISAIAKQNDNVVVVLTTGDPITMPWKDDVNAILQTWYPGQAGGEVTAELLLGKANPSGKLPVSFPAKESDLPFEKKVNFPGEDGELKFSEGIYVGYRWFDKVEQKPLFPFGHGLSYTEFKYTAATVSQTDLGYAVRFNVTNSGPVAGADIPQLYLGAPEIADIPVAVKSLVGFERVELASGETKAIELHIDQAQLNFWDINSHQWKVLPGKRTLYLGHSADDYSAIGTIQPK